MNIFLFGATGGTGKETLIKLLEQGHRVTVLARNPEVLGVAHANLHTIRGNVYQSENYQEKLSQCEMVISTLGTGTNRKPTEIYSQGGQQIIEAMRKEGKKRLITVTSGAFDPTDPQSKRFVVKYIVQPLFKNIYADMQRWETILENSMDIDWTIIRPTRLIDNNEKGSYRTQLNHCPKGGGKIGRKDLANFIVQQIHTDKYIHQKVTIAY